MVANSKLCGKCPSEKPCSPSRRSASGPVTPASSSASPDTSSIRCSRSKRRISRRSPRESRCERGQAHQRRWCRHQTGPRQCRGRSSSARCRRRRPPRWGRRAATPRRAHPGHRCLCAAAGLGWTCRRRAAAGRDRRCGNTGADDARQRIVVCPDRADGRSCTCAGSSSGCSESARPTTCFSNDRTPSESGLAAAGSPHASHFIGGRSSSR